MCDAKDREKYFFSFGYLAMKTSEKYFATLC